MAVNLHQRATKRGISYYLVIYQDGKVKKHTLSIDYSLPEKRRRQLAEIAAADMQRELMTDSRGFATNTNANFLTVFQDHIDLNKAGHRKYTNTLAHLRKCFGQNLSIRALTSEALEKWKQYLLDNFRGETPLTMWRTTLAVLNAMRRRGEMTHHPAQGISPPKNPDDLSKQVFSADELRALSQTAMPHEYTCRAFMWCCLTGMGRADLLLLRWSDVDLNRMQVKYQRAKTAHTVAVDLTASAISFLPERASGKVFAALPSHSFCDRMVKKWVKAAKIPKHTSWYCARHTFAVLLLEGGADILTVSKLLGHKSLQHTTKYLKLVDRLKRKAVDQLPEL